MSKNKHEIGFRHLSAWLKLAVIGGYISFFGFCIGFILGLMGW